MTRKHLTPSEKATLLDIHADNEPALTQLAHHMFHRGDDNDA